MVLEGDKANSHLIGGEIKVLPQPKNPKFGKYVLTPREVRKLLAEKGCNGGRRACLRGKEGTIEEDRTTGS